MHRSVKKIVVSLLVFTMFAAPLADAFARAGRSSGGHSSSFSSSRSSSSSFGNRAGGGGSVGMSRPSSMQAARSQSNSVAPAPVAAPRAAPTTAPVPAPALTRPGWVAPVAAGAVGLAAGYALSQAMTPSVNNQQGYGQSGNGYQGNSGQGGYPNNGSGGNNGQYGDPVAGNGNGSGYAPSAMAGGAAMKGSSGGGFGFGSFLLLLILAGVGYAVYRKMQNKPATSGYVDSGLSTAMGQNFESAAAPAQVTGPDASQQLCADLLPNVQRLFIELQELNNKGDLLELARRTMPDVYEAMKADITGRTEPSQTNVLRVDGRLVECVEENGDIIASIRYSASISERADGRYPEDVNEVWHYVKTLSTNGWILAGIEQL